MHVTNLFYNTLRGVKSLHFNSALAESLSLGRCVAKGKILHLVNSAYWVLNQNNTDVMPFHGNPLSYGVHDSGKTEQSNKNGH